MNKIYKEFWEGKKDENIKYSGCEATIYKVMYAI